MTRSDVAFDSNVLLYLISGDQAKADKAESLLEVGGVVSVQVLNEIVSVARRKFRLGWSEVSEMLDGLRANCTTVGVSVETHEQGLGIARRFGYHIYDSVILAASIENGCTTLYSEDLQDGQEISGLTIRNPFAGF